MRDAVCRRQLYAWHNGADAYDCHAYVGAHRCAFDGTDRRADRCADHCADRRALCGANPVAVRAQLYGGVRHCSY